MPAGRPPFYKTASAMQKKIDEYFKSCEGEPLLVDGAPYLDKYGEVVLIGAHPPTVTGLALALGFLSRQSLIDYADKGEFADTIARAKARVEEYCERRLFDRDGQRGAEFSLKYNFRWSEPKADDEDEGGGVVCLAPVMENPGPPVSEGADEQ